MQKSHSSNISVSLNGARTGTVIPGKSQQHLNKTGVKHSFPCREASLNPAGNEDLYPGIHIQDLHHQTSQGFTREVLGLTHFKCLLDVRLICFRYKPYIKPQIMIRVRLILWVSKVQKVFHFRKLHLSLPAFYYLDNLHENNVSLPVCFCPHCFIIHSEQSLFAHDVIVICYWNNFHVTKRIKISSEVWAIGKPYHLSNRSPVSCLCV